MILLDMDMPKSCHDCKLAHDEIYCSVTHKSILDQRIDFRKERLPECPLKQFIQPPKADFIRKATTDEWKKFYNKKTAPQ